MTTLPELQCFNQLLLKMLKRTQKKNEALLADVKSCKEVALKYESLMMCLANKGALDDLFICNQCDCWKDDEDGILNESACCDCGWICKDCEEEWELNFDCDRCECTFCRSCEENENGIHKYKDELYCSECIDDAVKEDQEEEPLTIEQTNSKRAVMEELIKKFAHSGI